MEEEYNIEQLKLFVEKSWCRLHNLAAEHRGESAYFHSVCEKYYGVSQRDLPEIEVNDRIIDTIDQGTDSLSFSDFDLLMIAAIKDRETGRNDATWDARSEIGMRTVDMPKEKR